MSKQANFTGAITGGVLFIATGVVLLLNSTAAVSWDVWQYILPLWPLLFIMLGVQIIFGRNVTTGLIAGFANSLVILIVFGVAIVNTLDTETSLFPGQEWFKDLLEQETVETNLEVNADDYVAGSIEKRDIEFEFNSGELSLNDTAEANKHLVVNAEHAENAGIPAIDARVRANELNLDFATKSMVGFNISTITNKYDAVLGVPNLSTDFLLDINSGKVTSNLQFLQLNQLELKLNSGTLAMQLNEQTVPDEPIKIDINSGDLQLDLPDNIALTGTYDINSGQVKILGEDLQDEGELQIGDLETAEKLVEMEIEVNSGVLRVE